MQKGPKKTFRNILQEEAPRSAWKLETKARQASWLAKIQPEYSSTLYSLKHAAVRQLFSIPAHAPVIREAWTTGRGFLLSIQLVRTHGLLHVPFDELNFDFQRLHGTSIARRAQSHRWQPPSNSLLRSRGAKAA